MIFLTISSLLFWFITYHLGYAISRFVNIGRADFLPCIFQSFLFGVVCSFAYFNLCSFFFPANYILLIPLFFVSVYVFFHYKTFQILSQAFRAFISHLSSTEKIATAFTFLAFFAYWIIPPINADSGAYHYLSIEWFEKFKVIPGLANIHGRFAFNPASFIISAPYSFSSILPQAIYPVNGTLIVMYIFWMFNLIARSNKYEKKICLLFVFIFTFRLLLVNISSPSSDALAVILATYIILTMLNYFNNNSEIKSSIYIVCFIFFALTVKLTLVPLLLFLPLLFTSNSSCRSKMLAGCISLIVIIAPWISRNYLMSGYLVYPLDFSDLGILNTDWKVPKGIIALDNLYIDYGPYMLTGSITEQLQLSFFQRLHGWIEAQFRNNMVVDLFLLSFSLFSVVPWMSIIKHSKKVNKTSFYVWVILYASVLLWIVKSPDYRFGSVYLTMTISIPFFFTLCRVLNIQFVRKSYWVALLLTCLLSTYYFKSALLAPTTYPFTLKDIWLFPLKDQRYQQMALPRSDQKILLNDGKTILYISSERDDLCLHVSLPCMVWNYGIVELRGEKITDGFRLSEDKVKERHPFLKY